MTYLPALNLKNADWAANQILGKYDVPAYARRARQMEGAIEQLLEGCRQKRYEGLEMVRLRLGVLHGLAGEWGKLAALLQDAGQVEYLRELETELQPQLRFPVETTTSPRRLRNALQELKHSLSRFNRRWSEFVLTVDFAEVNKLIDGYNRYYILEKECVVRSALVARLGFRPRQHLTLEWLMAELPPLPVPMLKS